MTDAKKKPEIKTEKLIDLGAIDLLKDMMKRYDAVEKGVLKKIEEGVIHAAIWQILSGEEHELIVKPVIKREDGKDFYMGVGLEVRNPSGESYTAETDEAWKKLGPTMLNLVANELKDTGPVGDLLRLLSDDD